MKEFKDLKRNLKKDFSDLMPLRVAVLGDTSTQLLVQAIKGAGYEYGFNIVIWEADYDQIERQVFDASSEFYNFSPEIVILFLSSHKALDKYNKLNVEAYSSFAISELEVISRLYDTINDNLSAKIIYYNYPEIDDSVFGNYANKLEQSFLFQLRKLNYELMLFAASKQNFYLCDLSTIQNNIGKQSFFHSSIYINTEMVISIDALHLVAYRTLDIIGAINGKLKKCVILDLDNTTWGGIIGDDGLENIQIGHLGIGKAFTEIQHWIKKLKKRGIIIAVCSKNTESIAKLPFENHVDMVLRLEDIAVFVANWENKADNIRHIQSILNIGFDSMVFLDDNPFERNLVKENIPGICVPELPEDPADYLEYLYSLNLFETISYSNEDLNRTTLYKKEEERNLFRKVTNEADYLSGLEMVSLVEPFNKFNTPRVAQLSQRSNQFNLRTIRYTEPELVTLSQSPRHFTFSFTLDDKFGHNGLICVVILEIESNDTLFINTWFMSCRVLKRGMESFVLNTIAEFALDKGYNFLKGEYIATPKNDLVKDHYANLGFTNTLNYWVLNVTEYKKANCFIKRMDSILHQ